MRHQKFVEMPPKSRRPNLSNICPSKNSRAVRSSRRKETPSASGEGERCRNANAASQNELPTQRIPTPERERLKMVATTTTTSARIQTIHHFFHLRRS